MAGPTREQAREISELRGYVGKIVTTLAEHNCDNEWTEIITTRQITEEIEAAGKWDAATVAAVALGMLAERKRADGYARPA